ncbi:MAG: lysylphosphatidylglycerol synthase transmembrane domain-containing protein [Acidobacteriota bacterium]
MLLAKVGVSIGLLWLLFSRIDVSALWKSARQASLPWMLVALAVYAVNVLASTWRWQLLLDAQGIQVRSRFLLGSLLVALFFNNFLPSNIGGDVIRIRDTARPAGSKTLATAVVLMDRVLGLMGLVLVAAFSATVTGASHRPGMQMWPMWLWVGFLAGAAASAPALLAPAGFGRLLQPLAVFHPQWVTERIDTVTSVLSRFRDRPVALASCFGGAVLVQASMVVFFFFVTYALHLHLTFWDLAVIVPLSFIVQMLPVSLNGFGVREATYAFYFRSIGQPIESAILMSLVGTALVMAFSLSGAAVWFARGHH